jgi:hypothetical protein
MWQQGAEVGGARPADAAAGSHSDNSPCPAPAFLPWLPPAGYTPLHMAAGYMHTNTIAALLKGGADPEQEDRQGRRWVLWLLGGGLVTGVCVLKAPVWHAAKPVSDSPLP